MNNNQAPNPRLKISRRKVFLYSFASGIRFNLIGQMAIGDAIAILDLSSIKKWKQVYRDIPASKIISKGYLLFLIAQIISDIINDSNSHNFLRGWANIIVAAAATTFLIRLLWKSPDFIVSYLLGNILCNIFFGQDTSGLSLEDMEFFKFKLVPILTDIVLIVSYYFLNKKYLNPNTLYLLLIVTGLFFIAFDARSAGLVWLLTGIFIIRKRSLYKITFKRLVPYIFLFLSAFQGLYSLYVSEVLDGSFGGKHAKEELMRVESPYNPIALLITGRSETFVAITAIGDSPLWGHGSWAPDKDGKYTTLLYKLHGQEERANDAIKNADNQLIIPSHSVLLGTWMTAGLIGLLGFVYMFIHVLSKGFSLLKTKDAMDSRFSVIIVFYFFNFLWICLFSPLPSIKDELPVIIALFLVIEQKFRIANAKPSN